jgi:hypothetical protein
MPLATTNPLCRSLFILLGWAAFGLLAYKVSTTKIDNKIYDPFEILGIKSVSLGCRSGTSHWLQDPLRHNIYVVLFILTSHSSIEYFGKGHQVSLQEALQNTVSILPFHPSLIFCSLFTQSS